MCRYAFHNYKPKYACFNCRKTFRYAHNSKRVCPDCSGSLHNMGLDFKSPPLRDIKQWRKVEELYRNGIRFHSCGCDGPGYRPERLNQVAEFVEALHRDRLQQDEKRRFLLHLK